MRKLAHWLEEHSPSESVDLFRELAYSHARKGGAIGHEIVELIRKSWSNEGLRGLCEFEIDYEDPRWVGNHFDAGPVDASTLRRVMETKANQIMECRQALAYFQKVEDLEIGFDKEEVAMKKFLEAEELCRQTNSIIKDARRGLFMFKPRVASVIHAALRKIARVLGDVPTIGELDLRFGPGGTRGTRKSEASVRRKLAEKLQCSGDLSHWAKYLLEEMPHLVDIHSLRDRIDEDENEWSLVELEIIPAKLSFVPKTAKTYRSICTEPGLNVMVQAGIGKVMARRLAAVGVDIRDQTVNQRRAMEGSLTGALATLDLSSASDTVSREVVFELLPLDWASLLNRARSSNVMLPGGRIIRQEKFSSMGNGFTFPLETLIFWGLAAACCREDSQATVYGDDIVVPAKSYDLLVEVLTALGFVVNLKKSYHKGFFRESCGKDYYWGIDVRPIYQDGWVNGQSLFVLHNSYVRRGNFSMSKKVESYIHPDLKLWGPDGYGDGHLIGEHPKRRPAKYDRMGYSGYFFDSYVTRTPKDRIGLKRGEYVIPLYTIYRRSAEKWEFDLTPKADESNLSKLAFQCRFQRSGRTPGLGGEGPAPLPLPHGDEGAKALSLPGVAGYKKITIYTLRA